MTGLIAPAATNAVRDLRRREADIALRSGRPTDPNLVATRLRDTPAHLYATPAYSRASAIPARSRRFLGRISSISTTMIASGTP